MARQAAREETEDDVDHDMLAATMRRVFLLASGLKADGIEPDTGWYQAAATAIAMFNDQGDGDMAIRWKDFASMLYRAATRARGDEPANFDELPEPARRNWEAAGRHAANLISGGAEAMKQIANHENHWINYGDPELFHKKSIAAH